MMKLLFAIGACALLGTAAVGCPAPPPADDAAKYELLYDLYHPFTDPAIMPGADWNRIPFSPETAALVQRWQDQIEGPMDELNSFGWLCQCQDWSAETFTFDMVETSADGAVIRVDSGWGDAQITRFDLVEFDGKWLVDNITNASFPDGLKWALRNEIAK
ncbi:hypothetical protein [Pseudoblastomonas halimionae]|uniref:DUF3828 domain-containing protein n=1 Tax=Alteriqipengyuania halimionae TaxID=1926630 RepID=A0A6I4U1C0_9SPHN|nr:hypothetical protein [Alteriqipengyuania halimionae]MXP09074.1 hypothetical protein [Alteriqipengyuania halimionae]